MRADNVLNFPTPLSFSQIDLERLTMSEQLVADVWIVQYVNIMSICPA